MSDAKPVINLAVATTKPGGNGGKFEFKQCRIGPAIGLEKLGCSLYVVRRESVLSHITRMLSWRKCI